MLKRMLLMALALIVLLGAIFGLRFYQFAAMGQQFANAPRPAITVSAATAESARWRPYLSAIGTLKAFQGIILSTELDGTAEKILFAAGQPVEAGALLLQQDDSVEQAELKSFQAQLHLARTNFERDRSLFAKKAISQNTLDTSKSRLDEANAAVEKTQATIAKKAIRAPFAGRLGISQVDPGQYLKAGDPIVPLMDTQSLKVDFNLPGQDYPNLYVEQPLEIQVDAYPEQRFPGKISALDARVDPNTRNLLVRAVLPNSDARLVPGMFADIKIFARDEIEVIAVPQTAISYSLYGDSVFVLTPTEDTEGDAGPVYNVERVYVEVGQHQDDLVAVSGIEAGQQVVTSGQLKLTNGTRVVISNNL